MQTPEQVVIGCDVGDPISAVYVHQCASQSYLIIAGTMLGKLWVYDSRSKSRVCLSGYNEDAIRGIYCDIAQITAVIGDVLMKTWSITDSPELTVSQELPETTRFTRRSSPLIKYPLQNDTSMICMYAGLTSFFDIVTKEQSDAPFRLLHSSPNIVSACPVSFSGKFVLVAECLDDAASLQFRLVDFSDVSTAALGEFGWEGDSLEIFRKTRGPKICVQVSKLFQAGKSLLVSVRGKKIGTSQIFSFSLPSCNLIETFAVFRGEVLSLSISEAAGKFVTLTDLGEITLWPLAGGPPELRGNFPPNFKLDLVYPVAFAGNFAAAATDSGVFAVELGKIGSWGFLRFFRSEMLASESSGNYEFGSFILKLEISDFPRSTVSKRKRLFSKAGAKMDNLGLSEVTPENFANHIAQEFSKIPDARIVDVCAGLGGNTIAFARLKNAREISAVDVDGARLEKAKFNANEIYNIPPGIIRWVVSDFCETEFVSVSAVFISPPWGGKGSNNAIFRILENRLLLDLAAAGAKISDRLSLYLPRFIFLEEIAQLGNRLGFSWARVDVLTVAGKSKATVVHFRREKFLVPALGGRTPGAAVARAGIPGIIGKFVTAVSIR